MAAPDIIVMSPTEKIVNIDYYIGYKTNYAKRIGLTIDTSATECWYNPISITSKTTSAKSNISSRLDHYKNIEGFTSVCIQYEKVGKNDYNIYIVMHKMIQARADFALAFFNAYFDV